MNCQVMFTILSLITTVKDYVEVTNKLVEADSSQLLTTYFDLGAIVTYLIIVTKQFLVDFLSFQWLQSLWSLPIVIPTIASSMISEISVLDGYFHNAFTFLETPISYGNQNALWSCLEKFTIGLFNSLFLWLPTSTAHLICLRRFVMQGLEAGYIAGLGTIAGNVLWIGSVVFGFRFIVIPWLSFDLLRYFLGFIILIKYMWDSYTEKKFVLEDISKSKIFLINFLLAFTEQTSIYPFISNVSIGSDATLLESFPANHFLEFLSVHSFYLLGICIGSLSLLQFTCWFWENPAFNIYMWLISSFKVSTNSYYKFVNFGFLYLTMICAISSVPYFGLDYTLTNPIGLVHEDRLIDEKTFIETSFLHTKASDRNTRRNRGRHGRRERWKRRIRQYRTFDASLYDQGVYDLFTIEDLNYGFDRFWLRRKMRNHKVYFRLFPTGWMRNVKKQLSKPRLESYKGPRVEFFRILFEQVYHPEFHEYKTKLQKSTPLNSKSTRLQGEKNSIYTDIPLNFKQTNVVKEHSTLRKLLRKVDTRIRSAQILTDIEKNHFIQKRLQESTKPVYSKRWKHFFSKLTHNPKLPEQSVWNQLQSELLMQNPKQNRNLGQFFEKHELKTENQMPKVFSKSMEKNMSMKMLSKNDRHLLRYRTFLSNLNPSADFETLKDSTFSNPQFREKNTSESKRITQANPAQPLTLLHPLKFYLQKEKAFQRKLNFYGVQIFRNFQIENNAPYFRVMMKRFFYHFKPTLRWERTMRTATRRKALRKSIRTPRTLAGQSPLIRSNSNIDNSSEMDTLSKSNIQKPTHFYSLVNKRATRYRYQIYKDVLQHWYYSPFNRLLLKFDVDGFIKRQPYAHFLTKKEEHLLHLRRFLLAEHYDTLRWYTAMQHYRSMKEKIGGTKSFSSRIYNQQFQGTFKKIRHLFAITPSASENMILKFDQPLYNEFSNSQSNSIIDSAILHEELLADDSSFTSDDLVSQSTKIVREYLKQAIPIRRQLIHQLIQEKNSWELTNFLLKGQKTRGTQSVTNPDSWLAQEQSYFPFLQDLATVNKEQATSILDNVQQRTQTFFDFKTSAISSEDNSIAENLWISLLKKCQNQLYNQKSLRTYIARRVQKRQRQKQYQQKILKTRLEKLKKWFLTTPSSSENLPVFQPLLKTSIQKAIQDGILLQKNLKTRKLNSRQNRPEIQLPILKDLNSTHFNSQKLENLKNHLQYQTKLKVLENHMIEQDLKVNLQSLQNEIQNRPNSSFASRYSKIERFIQTVLTPLNMLSQSAMESMIQPSVDFLKKSVSGKTSKDLQIWRQQELALTKRKKIRKKLDRLATIKTKEEKSIDTNNILSYNRQILPENEPSRQKRDRTVQSWQNYENQLTRSSSEKRPLSSFLFENFKRKRTRGRFKAPGKMHERIKKRSLVDKLRRQFRFLKKYRQTVDHEQKKAEIFQSITKREYDPNSLFETREIKQQRVRQRKHRVWKKLKKPNYAQKRRKTRKRRRYSAAKIRNLMKKLKRIKSHSQIQNWWWQTFLPNFQASTKMMEQVQRDQQLQEAILNMTPDQILETDQKLLAQSREKVQGENTLQIGNTDYRPLSVPQALRIRNQLMENSKLKTQPNINFEKLTTDSKNSSSVIDNSLKENNNQNSNILNGMSEKFLAPLISDQSLNQLNQTESFLIPTNPMPFYAGWDETLRKFVVTNRLLSRKDATYQMNPNVNSATNYFNSSKFANLIPGTNSQLNFTSAPLQGMNAATTLYWQIPFTTYDPDQFFALGLDAFSPINWRRFSFNHLKDSTTPILVKMKTLATKDFQKSKDSNLSYNIQLKLFNSPFEKSSLSENKLTHLNKVRRTQKRYKRVKRHPRTPVWFPSGALTNQILPVHYVYISYKRSRLPRDRYLSRRLRNQKEEFPNLISQSFSKITDFTLRKRVKPKRKYHRKKPFRPFETLLLKRRMFRGISTEPRRSRPLSKIQIMAQKDPQNLEFKTKQRRKSKSNKQSKENSRIRLLRRRIQRQVIRPFWRYKPRAGGFTWPGDYLRLELVNVPKLASLETKPETQTRQIRKTKRKRIPEWQIQPKKYLLEKHNLQVFKKRLEKSQNTHQLNQKVTQLKSFLNSR